MFGDKEPIPLPVEGYPRWDILDGIMVQLAAAHAYCKAKGRPVVTLAYAQSLDGSIASVEGQPLALSSAEALALTHTVRAAHDAILVGIGCVLADNPRLTVRLIPGRSPQPVIVDSRLRCPLSANLLTNNDTPPWIVTTDKADKKRQRLLERAGARVIRINKPLGSRVNLSALLETLASMDVASIMVEGGAQIITSFLAERLVDQVVITIAPLLVGGLRAVDDLPGSYPGRLPRLANAHYEKVGDDFVIRADPDWTIL